MKKEHSSISPIFLALQKIHFLEAIETTYRELLVGATLTGMECFIVGEEFLTFDPEKIWVINAGVELMINEQPFCVAYNIDMRLWDSVIGTIEELTGEVDILELDAEEIPTKSQLVGQKITGVDFNWNWYHKLDENFVPVQEKSFIPFEIFFQFENGSTLQLASIGFSLENNEILNPKFNSQGQLLVAINERVTIEEVD